MNRNALNVVTKVRAKLNPKLVTSKKVTIENGYHYQTAERTIPISINSKHIMRNRIAKSRDNLYDRANYDKLHSSFQNSMDGVFH